MLRKLCEAVGRLYERHGRKRVISGDNYMWRHYLLFKGQEHDGSIEKKEYRYNAFLHNIRGSDEPVYHDHPWPYVTIILAGGYWEHTPVCDVHGVPIADSKTWYGAGSIRIAKPGHFHWLEMGKESTWTLFMRGKRVSEWGFRPMWSEAKIPWKEWTKQRKELGFSR